MADTGTVEGQKTGRRKKAITPVGIIESPRGRGRPRKRTVKIDEVVMDSLTWKTTKNLESIAQTLAELQERVDEVARLRQSVNQLRNEVIRANKAVMMALCRGIEPETWESMRQNEGITFKGRIN